MDTTVSSDIEAILRQHKTLVLDSERRKVKCCLTNHEMPLTVKAIEAYINGKRYKKVSQMAAFDFGQHKTHIIPSNKKKHLHEMFCTLTLRHIEKTPQAIQRHIMGRKYTNALARWKKCQETGEKFIPHLRRKGKLPRSYKPDKGRGEGNDSLFNDASDDHHSDQDSDNMSDLYPEEDFDEDEQMEEESEEENEEPVPIQKRKNEKDPKMKPSSAARKRHSDESNSDYDLSVLNPSGTSGRPAESEKPRKKTDSEASPVTNSAKPKLKAKRTFEEGNNQIERVKKEKKKRRKKKEKE